MRRRMDNMRLQMEKSKPKCDCNGTGYYGDNGPGQAGNREYQHCECRSPPMQIKARCPWCKEGIGAWEMSPEMAI